MPEPHKIIVRVLAVNGICSLGHRVGDQVVLDCETVNGRVCLRAPYSHLPKVYGMKYGAGCPWLDADHQDPDPRNPIVFEIRRVKGLNRSDSS